MKTTLKAIAPKRPYGERPMVSRHQQATLIRAQRRVRIRCPESQAASSFTTCFYRHEGSRLDIRQLDRSLFALPFICAILRSAHEPILFDSDEIGLSLKIALVYISIDG